MKKNCSLYAGNGDGFVPKNQNQDIHRSSKIDIKEIRKKFENLNCENETACDKQINCTPTPIVPFRRSRSKRFSSDIKIKPVDSPLKVSESGVMSPNIVNSSSAAVSVKERTKLFESPNSKEKSVHNRNTFHFGSSVTVSENSKIVSASNDKICSNGVKTILSAVTPPIKPPRSYAHSEKNRDRCVDSSNIGEISKSRNLKSIKVKCENLYEEIPDSVQSVAESSVSSKLPCKDVKKTLDTHKLTQHNGPQILQLTPKPQTSSKTQGILNYFKNLSSNANNLCEKVKQKHSNIFVDLTPTTVSPPKHYGTLKRSHSEEHIYAEPNLCRGLTNKVLENTNGASAPLHYMCSPVVHSDSAPQQEKVEEKNKCSRLSVRDMIYDSFSLLRTTPKDCTESADVTSNDGSETDVPVKAIEDRIIYVKSVKKQISTTNLCISSKLFEALFIVNISDNQPEVSYSFPSKECNRYLVNILHPAYLVNILQLAYLVNILHPAYLAIPDNWQ